MALVRVIVCLLGVVALCRSDYTFEEFKTQDLSHPPTHVGCVDHDGMSHEFGSEWIKDCRQCNCSPEGIYCLGMIPLPTEFEISEDCELIVDKQTCTYKSVMKSDKTKECSST